ncbi:response regulator [Robiginitalea sp. M366]|uniref:response regulator n=1 Tax=Robiginitalea aestuariiviva TaxID=3036903 RepID=UPI00240DCBF9|nr:response regulator [Robiginitalea aestuariiviva]MDG1572045.1 response regulator [Robiginitalea aestuariiviva]
MKRILIIEDHDDVRENTADLLELAGFNVRTAPDGRSGLEKANRFEPDLILCDIMMPGMDGYQLLERLQRNPATARIPFIFLTAKTEKTDVRKGMDMGADDYLTKPFEEAELLGAVNSRLKKHDFLQREFSKDLHGVTAFVEEAAAYLNLDHIERKYYAREYAPRDYLFREGDGAHFLYYMHTGLVKCYKTAESGKELVSGLFGPGQFVGQLDLLNPGGTYLESAWVMEPSEIYAIPKSDFVHLLDRSPEVAHRFMELISGDLIDLKEQLMQMAYWPVKHRVARTLLKLQDLGVARHRDTEALEIAREDLAGMVGTATETAIRALSELRAEGIIRMGRAREIFITDPERLARMADYQPAG